jgi:hypothetical protein
MLYRLLYWIAILSLFSLSISCEKHYPDKGNISFGSNYGMVNCPLEVYVFIDNINYGKIPDVADSVIDCSSPSNLNLSLPTGTHNFKIEIRSINGTCQNDTVGTVNIIKDECTPIFINILTIMN